MRKPFKSLSGVTVAALAFALTACSTPGAPSGDDEGDQVFRVGIAEIGQIGPVISVEEGIRQAFEDAGLIEGEDVEFIVKNAQSDQTVIPLMAKQLVQAEPDIILGLGSSVIIALAQETTTIPIIFGAMTDPVDAGVVESVEAPGSNLTGTSDLLDPTLLLELARDVLPDASELGIISNPGEQNSAVQLEAIEGAVADYDFELTTAPVTTPADAVPAALSLRGRVDAVILPQDNTVGEAFEAIAAKLLEANLPTVSVNVGRVEAGLALAGVGVDYFGLGVLTGEMAVKVLQGDAEPATMPVVYANSGDGGGLKTAINTALAEELGLSIPDSVLEESTVYDTSPLVE